METKVCAKCGCEKKLEQFNKNGDKYHYSCKECEKEYMKKYYQEHKNDEKFKRIRKDYSKKYIRSKESIEKHRLKTKEWRKNNKEHIKQYLKDYDNQHRLEKNQRHKRWVENNKEKVKEYQQKDYQKRATNPILKLKRNLRNRINDSFRKKKYKKNIKTEQILGCSVDEFIKYLLQTYKNNYGVEWDEIEKVHIDHIKPLAQAQTEEDVIKLCHYTNLQLLKAKDNLSKGKTEEYFLKFDNKIL